MPQRNPDGKNPDCMMKDQNRVQAHGNRPSPGTVSYSWRGKEEPGSGTIQGSPWMKRGSQEWKKETVEGNNQTGEQLAEGLLGRRRMLLMKGPEERP